MSRLLLAQQGYMTVASAIALSLNEQTSDMAETWLANEVCPVFRELATIRSFRIAVRWSCDHLAPGSLTDERRLVEAVDAALVRCAKDLTDVTFADTAETSAHRQDMPGRIAINPSDRATIEFIAGRPWLDLVCCEDFFFPMCELCLRDIDANHTNAFRSRGELRSPLGDYVERYMFARIDYWKSLLDRIWNYVFLPPQGRAKILSQEASTKLFDAKIALDSAIDRLRVVCRSEPRAQQRKSSVALTQIYAAYAECPNLEWLGIRPGVREVIRSCVRRRGEIVTVQPCQFGLSEIAQRRPASLCDPQVLRQIALSLQEITPFFEIPEDAEDLIAWAIDRARVVLVDRSPRAVFWDGNEVSSSEWDQHPREWNLLWVLGSNSGQLVDQMLLMHAERHPIKSRRHRLSQLLEDVPQLDGLIETVRRQGYRLDLKSDEAILLRDPGNGRLVVENTRRERP